MKFRALLVGVMLMVTSAGFAQETAVTDVALPTPTPTPTPRPQPKDVRKPTPTPTPTPKKLEAPKIEGTVINRAVPAGGFIGFNFVGNNVVLTFYDAKKKKAAVDVSSGVLRWEMKRKIGDDRASFSRGDANTLVSPKEIPPPHNIRFTLLLFKEGSDQAVETYVVTPTG